MEPTTTDSTGMVPADAGSIPANPTEIATSSVATSSAVAPVPAATATPRPVSQPTTALTSPTTTTTGVAAAASDTPALPQSADSNLLLLLGGGLALVIAVFGAWQLSRQSAKKDGGRGPCDSLKQILEAKKQELAMVTSKIEIERALVEALKEKVASVAKEKAEEAVVGVLGETAKEAKRLYDEVREKYEFAQKALELLKSRKARIEGEVEKSEAAYAVCCKGVQAGKSLSGGLTIVTTGSFKGTIVENSLRDKEILKKVEIVRTREDGGWTLHDVLVEQSQIPELAAALTDGPWYIHVWQSGKDDVFVIYKDKTFSIKYSDKSTWGDAVAYGRLLGIPDEQLDFLID